MEVALTSEGNDNRENEINSQNQDDQVQDENIKSPSSNNVTNNESMDEGTNEDEGDESGTNKDEMSSSSESSPPSRSCSTTTSPKSKRKRKRSSYPWDNHSRSPKGVVSRKKATSASNEISYNLSYLQTGRCPKDPSITKCRECRWKDTGYCRFEKFRKLAPKRNGILTVVGFSDPNIDPSEDARNLWIPSEENLSEDMDLETAKLLISQIGDQFCDLIQEENQALGVHQGETGQIAWKQVVKGVREMCDVCDTTIFNYHWACGKCGFVVCLGCYKARKSNEVRPNPRHRKQRTDRDEFQWLFCDRANSKAHELEKLMLTKIITGNSLNDLGKLLHKMRHRWNIPQLCSCTEAQNYIPMTNETLVQVPKNGVVTTKQQNAIEKTSASSSNSDNDDEEDDDEDCGDTSMLMSLLENAGPDENDDEKKENGISNGIKLESSSSSSTIATEANGNHNNGTTTSEELSSTTATNSSSNQDGNSLVHFVRSSSTKIYSRQLHPIRSMTLSESTVRYPNVPHQWLCSGKLLKLDDPTNEGNCAIFQDMWKRGQPVIVANIDRQLDKSLWSPESFSRDYGEKFNDLVNCMTGKILANQPIKKFWDGFDHVTRRLKDEHGNPMLLKLKDWPPGEDFADALPERFQDLMAALPLTDYTTRNGRMNLAARLPDNFVKPDLGPKMYIAYGSGWHLDKGTTNLHLDISDAVNVMVHVGVPVDTDNSEHMKVVTEAIEESDCDVVTIKKVKAKIEQAGALWHIYNSRDADKIRDLLNKVAKEKGIPLEPNHDPIHDQNWYLDPPLRKRLMNEYNVSGFPIVQCLGEAVFIPAGAPHQVRNLHNCIKIAEDFVSPENVSHCFGLTEEFRRLSDTHSNHEDKLQIKNIIYFSVKHALTVLQMNSKELNKDEGHLVPEKQEQVPAIEENDIVSAC